jgi:hypothetical protein
VGDPIGSSGKKYHFPSLISEGNEKIDRESDGS